jgi:hypothetical protein
VVIASPFEQFGANSPSLNALALNMVFCRLAVDICFSPERWQRAGIGVRSSEWRTDRAGHPFAHLQPAGAQMQRMHGIRIIKPKTASDLIGNICFIDRPFRRKQ